MAVVVALLGPLAQAASDVKIRDSSVSAGSSEAAVLAPLSLDTAPSGGLQRSLQRCTATAQQTPRGVAALSAWHPSAANLFTASTDASFFRKVQVLPGTSGLAWGAPVQFDVLLRVDGHRRPHAGDLGRHELVRTGDGPAHDIAGHRLLRERL